MLSVNLHYVCKYYHVRSSTNGYKNNLNNLLPSPARGIITKNTDINYKISPKKAVKTSHQN